MSAGTTFILSGLLVMIVCWTVSAASRRPAASWNYYHFNGSGFVAGRSPDGVRFLAVRDRMTPVVTGHHDTIEPTPLPVGKGAVAGICYIRNSGGLSATLGAYTPSPGVTVTISPRDGVPLVTQADEAGFFVAVLDAGSYTVSHGAFSSRVTLEKGTTVLVPLQTGKRMVN